MVIAVYRYPSKINMGLVDSLGVMLADRIYTNVGPTITSQRSQHKLLRWTVLELALRWLSSSAANASNSIRAAHNPNVERSHL